MWAKYQVGKVSSEKSMKWVKYKVVEVSSGRRIVIKKQLSCGDVSYMESEWNMK